MPYYQRKKARRVSVPAKKKRLWKRSWTIGSLAGIVLSAFICFPLVVSPAATTIAVFSLLAVCTATGWNLFSGLTGYLSFGIGAYSGLGAYVLAILCERLRVAGGLLPFALLPLVALIISLLAFPIGWLSLRTRGATFLIVTSVTALFLQKLISILPLSEGDTGMLYPTPPWNGFFYTLPFYYLSLTLALFSVVLLWGIRSSRYGLCLLALRDDEDRLSGFGKQTGLLKLGAFVLSCMLASMSGAVGGYFVGSVTPVDAFASSESLFPALMTLLGGNATVAGPAVGALLVEPLRAVLASQFDLVGLDLFLFGVVFLLLLLLLPQGIVPGLLGLWRKRRKRPSCGGQL